MPKRSRSGSGSHLELDCLRMDAAENARLVDNLKHAGEKVNFVVVRGNECSAPEGIEAVTDAILYLTDEFPKSLASMLQTNGQLHVSIYLQHVALDVPFDPQIDRRRVHAAHVVMHAQPPTFEEYALCCAELGKSSQNVYQQLDGVINMQWVREAGVDKFVISDKDFNLQELYGQLTPGSVVIHLGSLEGARAAWWSRQAIAALESEDVAKYRKTQADEEKVAGDQSLQSAPLRDAIHRMTSAPVQNPTFALQPYHMFQSGHGEAVGSLWLRYLHRQHPRFCTFPDDMFLYKADEGPTSDELLEKLRRFGVLDTLEQNDIPRGSLIVNRHFMSALSECEQPLMVGTMVLWTDDLSNMHSNAIIIDMKKGTLARFEPLGSDALPFYDHTVLDQRLSDLVRDTPAHFSEYVAPIAFCAEIGPQDRADKAAYDDFKVESDEWTPGSYDRGWCELTSLMFIHYVIAYPEKPLKEVEKMLSSKSGGQLALEIRSYANHIVGSFTQVATKCAPFICTSIKGANLMIQVQTCMTDSYPRTEFRRVDSVIGPPRTLVRFTAMSEENLRILKLGTKMADTEARKLMTPQDTFLVSDSEIFTFYQVLNVMPIAQHLLLCVTEGFPWYVEELREKSKLIPPSELFSDLKVMWNVDERGFSRRLAEANITAKTDFQNLDSALHKAWIKTKSIEHRVAYYKDLGFEIKSKSNVGIDLSSTRENIMERYNSPLKLG